MTGKEPLTYYDMNLSAQDHQTFFTGDTQQLRPEDAGGLFKLCLEPISSVQLVVSLCVSCKHSVSPEFILSDCSDAEGLEGEKSSSQDQSSLPGHRDQPRVSHELQMEKKKQPNSRIFYFLNRQQTNEEELLSLCPSVSSNVLREQLRGSLRAPGGGGGHDHHRGRAPLQKSPHDR